MEYNIEKLNDDWIRDFENTDKLYKDFYKDDLYYVTLRIIYVNRNSEIDKIKQESLLMIKPNCITQEEVIGILKKNSIDNERRYSLLSILRYNIDLDSEEVPNYLVNYNDYNDYNDIAKKLAIANKNNTWVNTGHLSVIKNIDTITFERTINMFHDLNDLIIIFYEKSDELKRKDNNTTTRKIYLRKHSTGKKTIRKQYKD
jgi:hypothetical protein